MSGCVKIPTCTAFDFKNGKCTLWSGPCTPVIDICYNCNYEVNGYCLIVQNPKAVWLSTRCYRYISKVREKQYGENIQKIKQVKKNSEKDASITKRERIQEAEKILARVLNKAVYFFQNLYYNICRTRS